MPGPRGKVGQGGPLAHQKTSEFFERERGEEIEETGESSPNPPKGGQNGFVEDGIGRSSGKGERGGGLWQRNGERVCHRVHNPGFKVRVLVSLGQGSPGAEGKREAGKPVEKEGNDQRTGTHTGSRDHQGLCERAWASRGQTGGQGRVDRLDPVDGTRRGGGAPGDPFGDEDLGLEGKTGERSAGLDPESVSPWKQDGTGTIWNPSLAKESPSQGWGKRKRGMEPASSREGEDGDPGEGEGGSSRRATVRGSLVPSRPVSSRGGTLGPCSSVVRTQPFHG